MTYSRLDHEARELIMSELARDRQVPFRQIAERVKCHRSTIQREVARNGGRDAYRALAAQQRARRLARRRWCKFETDPELADAVRHQLVTGYSPFAVSRWYPVSAETIYQAIYSDALGLNPRDVLRTRRPKRRHRRHKQPTSDGNYLGDFVPISNRPLEIENRDVVGHWEGDLITGARNQSAIVTLVERCSRYQCAIALPNGHGTKAVIETLSRWLDTRDQPVLSLTWDRGAELTNWQHLTTTHSLAIYFCDPKSPWQRATSENHNRQLRFWFPKGTDLSTHHQDDIDRACHILNTTPRRLHNNATAHDIYHHNPRTRE